MSGAYITDKDNTPLKYLITLSASFYPLENQHRVLIGRAALTEPFYAYIVGIPAKGAKQELLLEPQSGSTRAQAILNLTQDLESKVHELMRSMQEGGTMRPVERTVKRCLDGRRTMVHLEDDDETG